MDSPDAYSRRRVWTGPTSANYAPTNPSNLNDRVFRRPTTTTTRKPLNSNLPVSHVPSLPPRPSRQLQTLKKKIRDDSSVHVDSIAASSQMVSPPSSSRSTTTHLEHIPHFKKISVDDVEIPRPSALEIPSLFRRPCLNADLELRKDLKAYDAFKNSFLDSHTGPTMNGKNSLISLQVTRLIYVLQVLPILPIPRFLTLILPILMTHHTTFVGKLKIYFNSAELFFTDTDITLSTLGLPSQLIFIPTRLIAIFGISWNAVSFFNSDTASSTATTMFVVLTRVIAFFEWILAFAFDRRPGTGRFLFRRAGLMVWVPSLAIMLGLFVDPRLWMGFRDSMWAIGGGAEIIVAATLNYLEFKHSSAFFQQSLLCKKNIKSSPKIEFRGGKRCSSDSAIDDGSVVLNLDWKSQVRIRLINLTSAFIACLVYLSVFPNRKGVGDVDSVSGMQFVIGPFISSAAGLLMFYFLHWLYRSSQDLPANLKMFLAEQLSDTVFADFELKRENSENHCQRLLSAAPPFAFLWRIFHVPIWAGLIITGAGTKVVLQNVADEWLGMAGFYPTPPTPSAKISTPPSFKEIELYVNITTANTTQQSISQIKWDFSAPHIWILFGVTVVLVFTNTTSFIAKLSTLKMLENHSAWENSRSASKNFVEKLKDEDWAISSSTLIEEDEPADDTDTCSVIALTSRIHDTISAVTSTSTSAAITAVGNFNKTQSVLNFSTFNSNSNNKLSKQSFYFGKNNTTAGIRTPTPSIISPSLKSVTKQQITALSNDDKFWKELVENSSSPTPSRHNSIGSEKDFLACLNNSTPVTTAIVSAPTQTTIGQQKVSTKTNIPRRHVSINIEEGAGISSSRPHRERLMTSVSVSEDNSNNYSRKVSPKTEKLAQEIFNAQPAILYATPIAGTVTRPEDQVSSTRNQIRRLKTQAVWSLILHSVFAAAVCAFVPLLGYLSPLVSSGFGNFGNIIDCSTITLMNQTVAANSIVSEIVIGSEAQIMENVEGVLIIFGCTLFLAVLCVGVEIARVFEAKRVAMSLKNMP
ncbi:hypothetical protein HK100_003019 [Physocladia obscura]|uniref:Uncharacterized protein n=1 Tax=Physocladia obscura TaxID=109957 RepID=A0AAD5SW37_9FUNG|nr:hypothetical protein HK100_003019 [Physocladia obscura]